MTHAAGVVHPDQAPAHLLQAFRAERHVTLPRH
jgi:hypothetical protein